MSSRIHFVFLFMFTELNCQHSESRKQTSQQQCSGGAHWMDSSKTAFVYFWWVVYSSTDTDHHILWRGKVPVGQEWRQLKTFVFVRIGWPAWAIEICQLFVTTTMMNQLGLTVHELSNKCNYICIFISSTFLLFPTSPAKCFSVNLQSNDIYLLLLQLLSC